MIRDFRQQIIFEDWRYHVQWRADYSLPYIEQGIITGFCLWCERDGAFLRFRAADPFDHGETTQEKLWPDKRPLFRAVLAMLQENFLVPELLRRPLDEASDARQFSALWELERSRETKCA